MESKIILDTIKKAVDIEYECVGVLRERIGNEYVRAVEILYNCSGRIIFSGAGKSGIVAKKISSTFSSIGTPSIFIHPSDAVHGDLGSVTADDVAFMVSNSGKTEEILFLLPVLRQFGVPVISIVGDVNSELARNSDVVLDASVGREATPIDLVPTSSTTVATVIGDALAAGLIVKRGFKNEDFGFFHPAGTIGKRLVLRVKDLMHTGDEMPVLSEDDGIEDILYEISSKRLGVGIVSEDGFIKGIITDGDLRRAFERYKRDIFDIKAKDIMTRSPKTIHERAFALEAANVMESYSITNLAVVGGNGRLVGVIHIHDILKAGIL